MNDQKQPQEQPGSQPKHEHAPEHIDAHDGTCHEMLSTLCDYVDGTLSEELCAEVERHMQDCPTCRIVVDTTRKTIELYQATTTEENLPADVHDRLFVRLNLDDFLKK